MAAPDPVACWGAAELMRREFDLPITAITGPATDNEVGQVYITTGLGLAGAQRAAGRRWDCWRWCGRRSQNGRRGRRRRTTDRPAGSGISRSVVSVLSRPLRPLLMKVAVVGAAGYAGGELLRLLLQHPEVTECVATSRSQAGKPIAEVHPALGRRSRMRGSPARRRARSRAGATSSSSASSTASRRASPARCSTRARSWSWISPRISGCATPSSTSGSTGRTPRPSCCPASPTGWPTWWAAGLRGATRDRRARLLRHGGAARALSAGVGGTRCHAVAVRHHRLERRRRAATPDDPPSRCARTTSSPTRCSAHRHEAEVLQSWREWVGRPDATARLMTHSGPFVRGIYLTLHAFVPRQIAIRGGEPGTTAAALVPRGVRAAVRSSACSTRRPS